jgi:tetratricopeptide (TPR) repeat protein
MKNSEQDLKNYLKPMSVLLVTETATDRTAWKKLFSELGVVASNFHNCSIEEEAIELIKTKNIDILFCSYMLDGAECYPLLDAHIEKYPNRADSFCYMVSEKNSLAIAASAVECDVDGVLIKPYNQKDLQETVTNSLISSMNMSKRTRTYHKILCDIRTNNLDQALLSAETFIEERPESPNGYYLKGLTKRKLGELESAIEIWEIGLSKDDKHHKIICSIFDTYIELREFQRSYDVAEVLTASFPVNPTRIPNLIRSSLATENFHNLISFCEMIVGVDDDLSFVQKPIAAALAICGKKLLENINDKNLELIIKASQKAIALSPLQSAVYITSLKNLYELEKYELINEYIEKIPSDELTVEMLSLELEVQAHIHDPAKVFANAQSLVKINKATPSVYKILLKIGKQIGKSESQLEDIYFEGSKKFPDITNEFKSLID